MSADSVARVADLLHEAAETHHTVFRITDGEDPDWASWYADWLLDLSELTEVLGVRPVRSHVVHALVGFDRVERELRGARGGAKSRSLDPQELTQLILRVTQSAGPAAA